MGETRIELTGWKAMIVAVIILAVTSYRIYSRFPTVSDDGRKTLREWLVKDYTGRGPRALARRVHAYQAGLPDQPVAAPEAVPNVELVSLLAHGWRDAMVVRSEISVDGGTPPRWPADSVSLSDDEGWRRLDGVFRKRLFQILRGIAEIKLGELSGHIPHQIRLRTTRA